MSANDNKLFDPEKISIIEFKIVKGQVDTPEDFDISKVEGHNLDNSLQFGFNLQEKLVKSDLTIKIKTDSKGLNLKESTGNFHLVFIFHVDNLDELAKADEHNLIEIHPALGNAVSSITYSTSRGILLAKFQGTALQNFVLPIINPNKLLANEED